MMLINELRYSKSVLDQCTEIDGVVTRAVIRKIKCRICGQDRFDDGTPCMNQFNDAICGAYQNKDIPSKIIVGGVR